MTLTVRSATVTGATTKGSPLSHAELDANWAHVIESSNHNFTQSGTGASTRTMQDKAREIISIKDFGATGDGSTDDSAAIQEAVDALVTSGGGCIWSPEAAVGYKINTGIAISLTADTDVSITFAGMGDRSRWNAGGAITMLNVTTTVLNIRRVTIKDMMFNLNSLATVGVRFHNCAADRILDSHFVNGQAPGKLIQLAGTCSDIFISRNYFLHFESGGVGISVEDSCKASTITENFFGESSTTGIDFASGTEDFVVAHNVFYTLNTCVKATASDRHIISDNIFRETDGHAVHLLSCDNIQVRGNLFRDYGNDVGSWYGVFVTTASSTDSVGCVIENNTFLEGDASHVRIASASGNAIGTVVRNNYFDTSTAGVRVLDGGIGTIRTGNINDDYIDLVRLRDHFLGDVIADQWGTAVGTDAQCLAADVIAGQIGGWARLGTGNDAAADMATNGTQLHSGLNWEASQGALIIEARLKINNIADVCVFFGFTDQIAALEMPIESAASADTITTNATNAVGFMYDTSMATDNWWLTGVAADNDATAQNSGTAPSAGTFQILKIALSTSGQAIFYINGTQVGTVMSGAITAGTNITPVVAAFARAAAQKLIDIDYIDIQGTPV